MKRWALLAAPALVLAGLGVPAVAADSAGELPLPEFMAHVMQRNALQLWAWSAEEEDASGPRSGRPVNDEQWEEAESDALTVGQLAHALRRASFAPDDPRWVVRADALADAAAASAGAAERKDYAAFSRAGEQVNAACVACHLAFAPALETVPPPAPL